MGNTYPIFDPTTYGADPKGNNDSSDGLAKALHDAGTFAANNYPANTIVLTPPGLFVLNDSMNYPSLTVPAGVTLQGSFAAPVNTDALRNDRGPIATPTKDFHGRSPGRDFRDGIVDRRERRHDSRHHKRLASLLQGVR